MWLRPGLGTLDRLYTLTRIVEGAWELTQSGNKCFVDLDKACDFFPQSVLRGMLWERGSVGYMAFCYGPFDLCNVVTRAWFT